MGFLKKLKKRDDRFVRLAKNKAAKRDAREARRLVLAHEAAERELSAIEDECLYNTQVIFLTALHEVFGFGARRLLAVSEQICWIASCIKDKKCHLTIDAMRDQMKEETGYFLDMHDIPGGPEIQVQKRAVDQVSVVMLWVLKDKFGFGKKRLERMYHASADIGSELHHGKRTIKGMMNRLAEGPGIRPVGKKGLI